MRATTFLLGTASLLAMTQSVWAANSQCVENCEVKHATVSWCNGNETGKALAKCTCASFTTTTPMIKCIKECPTADQSQFAAGLPSMCRGELFPGVKVSSTTTTSASGEATSTGASPTTTNGAAINAPTQIAMVGAVLAGLLV
ncbi:hypothetical protein N7474_007140 [Penicillium riverlandense]|uniref:uncharacterized protein n=1 Tax=Penicillium riverlandense TaxID=1903569 RepID=UPI002547575D|nr:uncharacterized protein N7474_007140 [Penicillium riverlandense]KAJ5815363.1 hypothetical protein N7474_007140 [Penicillium riverlandense]